MSNKKSKVGALIERAYYFQSKGQFKKSAEFFQQVLRLDASQPEALHQLGVFAHEAGRLEEAVQLLVQSLQVDSNNASALNDLAAVLKDQKRFPEALEFYQAAMAMAPNEAYLHGNLGLLMVEMQRPDDAIACYQRALELNPKSYPAHFNLGNVYRGRGEWKQALDCYWRALALNPQGYGVLANIGTVFNEQELYAEAVPYHEAALKIAPHLDLVQSNLGVALHHLKREEEAIVCYRRALELNPRSHTALNNLGNLLRERREFAQAVICLKQAVELKPDCFQTMNSLGAALMEQGALEEALLCFDKALLLEPGDKEGPLKQLHRNIGVTHYAAGHSIQAVEWFRKAIKLPPDTAGAFSDLLFILNHLQQDSPEELFAEHLRFGQRFDRLLEKIPHPNDPAPDRRLRVGFVSGDLREHPVAYFIEPVFTTYNKSQFEVFCYENHPVNDAVSERIRSKVDSWLNVDSLSDDQLASRIRADRIDILVDLSGHTGLNRLLVFARKPAPVQVTMVGYMQTTGLAAIDYRITDCGLDPVGATEHLSTEKLIRLPAGATPIQPPRDCPPVNELPALKNGYVTFSSFNKPSKITSEILDAWAKLLHATSGSHLLVAGLDSDFITDAMALHGIGPERLELYPRKSMKEYLALHHRADFALDTFPYNGGTTSLIATWMGLPFVTIQGSTTISRCGACILNGMGLPDLIADNPDAYVQKAVDAVQDLPRLAQWREVLRSRFSAIAGDGSGFTRQLEEAFREMWKEWGGRVKGEG